MCLETIASPACVQVVSTIESDEIETNFVSSHDVDEVVSNVNNANRLLTSSLYNDLMYIDHLRLDPVPVMSCDATKMEKGMNIVCICLVPRLVKYSVKFHA